jgi:hypothetical protein
LKNQLTTRLLKDCTRLKLTTAISLRGFIFITCTLMEMLFQKRWWWENDFKEVGRKKIIYAYSAQHTAALVSDKDE